ncbi:MAG: hypothetical protein ACYC7L_06895 [Nitrospirota bacterium]
MKILIIILVLLTAGAVGYNLYRTATVCDRAYEEYRVHVSQIDAQRLSTSKAYQWEVSQDLRKRQAGLIEICFDKRHMPIAGEMLDSLIAGLNAPQYLFDRKLPRNSAQVKLIAIYYRKLAAAYEVTGDEGKKEQALKNAQKYEAEAARMKK